MIELLAPAGSMEALRAAGVAVNENFHRNFVDSYRMIAG